MHTSPLRIGIAGLGRMGRHHATNLAQRVQGAEVVAGCSPITDELAWATRAVSSSATRVRPAAFCST